MRRYQFFKGIASLLLGVVLLLMNVNKVAFPAGKTDVIIYPIGFLALLGVILIAKSLSQSKQS